MLPVVEDPIAELAAIEAELRRRRWESDPVAWARERLGDHLWSKQQEIIRSVRDHRRTAVQSCHAIGKSFIASVVAGWWLDTKPVGQAFVVTSAPTANQVRAILWREIGRVWARGKLRGRVNQTEWFMEAPGLMREELVAFGRKPDDYEPTAFQGIHARWVLYIFDEACGIPASLWEAADSLIANDESKAMAIGNPDDPQTEFCNICKPGSGWNVVQVGAFDTPNFTGEEVPAHISRNLIGRSIVEEKRKKWAMLWEWTEDGTRVVPPVGVDPIDSTNPLWQSKILGLFPKHSEAGTLIPLQWITEAQKRHIEPKADDVKELGVDVGGGGDSSCGALRHGGRVRIQWEDKNPSTMQTCGNVARHLQTSGASKAKIDMIGIGRGVVDRGIELGLPFEGINVGAPAKGFIINPQEQQDREGFVNLRAELWWNVRQMFERGEIDLDPLDEDLAAELVSIRYRRTSSGKIQIESKDEAKRRGVASPNRADAVMLALAPGAPELICG